MPTSKERFEQRARAAGLSITTTTFPAGTRTAADAATAIGCEVDQIVKSLVFIADDQPVLVLASGANRVAERKLAKALGADDVRAARAEEVREITGYAIGGTPPFGHDQQLRTLLDRDLLDHDEVWAAAGTPDTVFALPPQQLADVSHVEVCDLAEGR